MTFQVALLSGVPWLSTGRGAQRGAGRPNLSPSVLLIPKGQTEGLKTSECGTREAASPIFSRVSQRPPRPWLKPRSCGQASQRQTHIAARPWLAQVPVSANQHGCSEVVNNKAGNIHPVEQPTLVPDGRRSGLANATCNKAASPSPSRPALYLLAAGSRCVKLRLYVPRRTNLNLLTAAILPYTIYSTTLRLLAISPQA